MANLSLGSIIQVSRYRISICRTKVKSKNEQKLNLDNRFASFPNTRCGLWRWFHEQKRSFSLSYEHAILRDSCCERFLKISPGASQPRNLPLIFDTFALGYMPRVYTEAILYIDAYTVSSLKRCDPTPASSTSPPLQLLLFVHPTLARSRSHDKKERGGRSTEGERGGEAREERWIEGSEERV